MRTIAGQPKAPRSSPFRGVFVFCVVPDWGRSAKIAGMKVVVEKHADGYVAYPLGLKGIVVGQGDTSDQALADVLSAIRFHLETFGKEATDDGAVVLDAFITELQVA